MRIAHLSDIHIMDWSSFSFQDLFNKRIVGALNLCLARRGKHDARLFFALGKDLQQINPEQIVITGDLTNLSLRSEFSQVQKMLQQLGFSPSQLTIIPGNHDAYVHEAEQKRLFQTFLGPYALSDKGHAEFPFVRIRDEVALIGTSSAIPTYPFLAKGVLGKKQLEKLEPILLAHTGYFRVLLIHHPPVPYRHDKLRGLQDKEALQRLLKRTGCELILHGHEHRDLQAELSGPLKPIPVIGVGSGTYTSLNLQYRARYNIYTIENHCLVGIETRVHHPKSEQFILFSSRKMDESRKLVRTAV